MGAALFIVTETKIGKLVIRLPSIEAHEIWAPFYDSMPNPLLALARRSLADLLKGRDVNNVIDVACGTGQGLGQFEDIEAHVIGVDASGAMLREAKRKMPGRKQFVQGDARSLPFGDRWADLVICSMSLGYFDDLDVVFREFARVACAGASVIVCDVHPQALAAGWTRSFNAASIYYEIQHFCYSSAHIARAARRSGLSLGQWFPMHLGEPESPIFEQAGKGHLFKTLTQTPALFVATWERP